MIEFLKRIADYCDICVRVFEMGSGVVDQFCRVHAADGRLQRGLGRIKVVAHRRFTEQPRTVGHQLSQYDRLGKRILRMEIGDVLVYGCIQVDLACFHHLHDGDVSEQF